MIGFFITLTHNSLICRLCVLCACSNFMDCRVPPIASSTSSEHSGTGGCVPSAESAAPGSTGPGRTAHGYELATCLLRDREPDAQSALREPLPARPRTRPPARPPLLDQAERMQRVRFVEPGAPGPRGRRRASSVSKSVLRSDLPPVDVTEREGVSTAATEAVQGSTQPVMP